MLFTISIKEKFRSKDNTIVERGIKKFKFSMEQILNFILGKFFSTSLYEKVAKFFQKFLKKEQ